MHLLQSRSQRAIQATLPKSKPSRPYLQTPHTRLVSRQAPLSTNTTPPHPRRTAQLPTSHTFTFKSPFTSSIRTMSSDDAYASFLDKANQDTGSASAKSSSGKKSYGTKSVDTAVPSVLEKVEEYFVSDADEPFEPVSLKFGGKDVSAGDLKKLLGGDKDVEEDTPKGFESQYKSVVEAVKKAGNGEVKIFRVTIDGTRAEYYVVGVDEEEGRVVGLKALSVES